MRFAFVSVLLATSFQAKSREGILSPFPAHVGAHFNISSSFETPLLFVVEVLARVIALPGIFFFFFFFSPGRTVIDCQGVCPASIQRCWELCPGGLLLS